ncbi:MAG: DUF1643 domain-containing protein [Clostridia bacterium]|nr:DUF1643 domain-containing protein [Clostridia bacterium]
MGHIPQGESTAIDILTFDEARARSEREAAYDTEKWMYYPSFYSEYRYVLGTKGRRPLICIGINPSTAEPGRLDNTVKTVERLAAQNGYDSFIMFNVYAQRATKPDDMDKVFNEALHRENMNAFRFILSGAEGQPHIWAAWGTIVEKRPYLKTCLKDMLAIGEEYGALWLKTGKVSKAGHPHHPLYLPNGSVFEPFDIGAYLSK